MNKLKSQGIAPIIIMIIIVGVLAVAAGGYFVAVKRPTSVVSPQTQMPPLNEYKMAPPTAPATCDNYQCLISAAAQCQPISVIVSYSGMPSPFLSGMLVSGQTKYEIKKSSGVNDCVLVFSSPVTVFSISNKGREAALAKGMTDAQITAQLQTMNDSLKSVVGIQTCPSNTSAISAYLTDMKDNGGNLKIESKVNSTGQTTTYTASAGQKLICTTVTLPKEQP